MKTTNYNTEELEAKLFERFGQKTPFTVPEGYFEGLTDKVMSRIAERKHRRNLIWRWTAAAVLAGCVAAGGLLFESHYKAQQLEAENIQYIEDALDYSMIDNMSIESYLLTEAE